MDIDQYVSYEIDPYCTKTSKHNFPDIEQNGDVFQADFNQYKEFDWLVGGSPCTYWSIAQTKNRETTASGLGWELFSQYVRALHEAKPKYFIYENNKSMSKDIRASITDTFGFEPICINSALVSAQNRQRLYWCGIRQEDGSYKKANIEQPEDRYIMLKDILETNHKPLSENEMDYMVRNSKGKYSDRWSFTNKPGESDKSVCVTANVHKGVPYNVVAQPVCVAQRGRNPENPKIRVAGLPTEQMFEAREDYKTNTLTTVQKDNMVAEPIRIGTMPSPDGTIKGGQALRVYSTDGKSVTLKGQSGGGGAKTGLYAEPINIDAVKDLKDCQNYIQYDLNGKGNNSQDQRIAYPDSKFHTLPAVGTDSKIKVFDGVPECFRVREATKQGYTDIQVGGCVDMSMPNSKTRRGRNMENKCNCLQTSCEFYQYCGTVNAQIYEVKDGMITVKGKQYPIKLIDGYYIIRKLTVLECMRLQTVPEWYEFPVSNSQAYKMLGNGWTVEVIIHLIKSILKEEEQK